MKQVEVFGIYQWRSLALHANIDIKLGPLSWLIASPEFHHWHHTNRREAYDKNFAGQLPI
jgi:sterol desaturase/sphingolipid hydroxylase (fatty acid hydroxylase superfamily)